jgi:TonB-linked SusC/RagA family outer membrane protein
MQYNSNGILSDGKVIDGYEPLEALVAPKLLTSNDPNHLPYTIRKTWLRAMKLTAFIILIACLQVSARTNAQRLSISLKNSPLEKLFSEIEHQTSYVFFYDAAILKDAKPVTVEVHDASVEDILKTTLKGQSLDFSINDKTIFVKKEATPVKNIELAPVVGGAGPNSVSGVVRSETGTPLAGATVTIPKLKRSGVTDAKGEFTLKDVPNGEYWVEITFVGYQPYGKMINVVNNEATIVAEMKIASSSLDQVVFKGYYNTTNRLNTGDVTTVKGEDIQKQPVTDPILALEGRVPGLNIQQASGLPGTYSAIRIRGQNSIGNGNDPLYIVDGVPYSSASMSSTFFGSALGQPYSSVSNGTGNAVGNEGSGANGGGGMSPFNSLNPSDIESVEVLKDADATAIYGSRGANGVILITTKKGRGGATRFDINVFTGGSKVTRMIDMLNTKQYLEMRHEAINNDGWSSYLVPQYASFFPDLLVYDTTRYTDWQKVLIGNTAKLTNVQGNLSGGNANTQFIIGTGYSNQGTVFPGSYSDQKASVHVNLTHASADQRFHALFTTNYVYDKSNLPFIDFTSNITLDPDAPAIYNSDGNLNWQILNGNSTWSNPFAITTQQAKATTTNLIDNLVLEYQLLSGLSLKSNLGYNQAQMEQSNLQPATSIAPPNNNNPASRGNSFGTTEVKSWIIEPQLSYKVKISKGQLDALVGATFQENKRNSMSQVAYGFSSDALISNAAAASTLQLLGVTYALYHYDAIFSRLNFNWEEKYLLNITARRDGSSRFGPGKQFGNFGAVGAGWIFTKERYVQDHLSFISYGKLRISYGTTGNDQIPDYQYLSSYNPNSSTYQGITGLSPTRMPNPYFAWESVKKWEGGLEIGIIRDKVLISTSYYRNRSSNQLIAYPLPMLAGFSAVQANFPATVQNAGVEFTFNTINIKHFNFSWSSSINLTLPKNKLVAFPNIESSPYFYLTVGQPLTSRQMYYSTGVNPQTGVYSFVTKNANGIPSYPTDFAYMNSVAQKWYGGVQNTLTYRRFQLDLLFQFTKQDKFNYTEYFRTPGSEENQPQIVMGRWQKAGDNNSIEQFTQDPSSLASNAYGALAGYPGSNLAISNASFIRLKNLAFSYQLPSDWQKKVHLQGVRIYLQGQNLFTVTKYIGLDPETAGLNLPPLRTITGGVQISL